MLFLVFQRRSGYTNSCGYINNLLVRRIYLTDFGVAREGLLISRDGAGAILPGKMEDSDSQFQQVVPPYHPVDWL
jgi:hypothetical protein